MTDACTAKAQADIRAILDNADHPLSTTEVIDQYWHRVRERGITSSIPSLTCVHSNLTRMCDADLVVRSPYRQAVQNLGMKPKLVPPNGTMSIYWALPAKVSEWRSRVDPEALLAERELENKTKPGYSPEPAMDIYASMVVPLVTDIGWHVVGEVEGIPLWQWQECKYVRVVTNEYDMLRDVAAALNYVDGLDLVQAHDFVIEHIDGRSGMHNDEDWAGSAI